MDVEGHNKVGGKVARALIRGLDWLEWLEAPLKLLRAGRYRGYAIAEC